MSSFIEIYLKRFELSCIQSVKNTDIQFSNQKQHNLLYTVIWDVTQYIPTRTEQRLHT